MTAKIPLVALVVVAMFGPTACGKGSSVRSMKEQLDLVPAESGDVLVVRDLRPLFAELATAESALSTLQRELPALSAELAALSKRSGDDLGEFQADLGHAIDKLAALRAAKLDPSKGLIAGERGGDKFIILGADGIEPLRALAMALERDPAEVDRDCAPIDGQSGYVACSSAGAAVAATYVAGNSGAARLEAATTVEPKVADALAWFGQSGSSTSITVTHERGTWHMALRGASELASLGNVLRPSLAPALRDALPGSGAYWINVDADGLRERHGHAVPGIASALVGSLTGEAMWGAVTGAPMVMRLGVSDPGPVAGLLGLGTPFLREWAASPLLTLAGAQVNVEQKQVQNGGASASVVHVSASGGATEPLAATGVRPEGVAFAAGGYATIALGTGLDFAQAQLTAGGERASAEWLAGVTPALAGDLAAGHVAALMYTPFDALHHTDFAALAESELDEQQRAAAERIGDLVSRVLAPYVSVAGWISVDESRAVLVHATMSTLGSSDDAEGRKAHEVIAKGFAGESTTEAFDELADDYDSSPFAPSYRARGTVSSSSASVVPSVTSVAGLAMLGGLVAAAVDGQLDEVFDAVK